MTFYDAKQKIKQYEQKENNFEMVEQQQIYAAVCNKQINIDYVIECSAEESMIKLYGQKQSDIVCCYEIGRSTS